VVIINNKEKGWERLTTIANDKVEKFRLNFSGWANRVVAPSSTREWIPCL